MSSVSIIFPNQLFEKNPCLRKDRKVYLDEEYLFFNQCRIHKQKLVFHRASMKFYEEFLRTLSYDVEYISGKNPRLNMLVRTFDKMNSGKQKAYLKTAGEFPGSIS